MVKVKIAWLTASLLTVMTPAWAGSSAHCPAIRDIKVRGMLYSARVDDGGKWLGIADAGSRGRVKTFDRAIIYPTEQPTGKAGDTRRLEDMPARFGKCSYNLEHGSVDLRFKPATQPVVFVSPRATASWQKETGAFDFRYFQCRQADPTACLFVYTD